jgi:hypothetical protein
MLELAFKLKQFATGMPSEIKEVKNTMTATVDVEWEIAIRKAYGLPEPEAPKALPPVEAPPPVVDVEEVPAQPSAQSEEEQ